MVRDVGHTSGGGSFWRGCLFWLTVLLICRVVAVLVLGWATGGQHFTDDWMHVRWYVEYPFQILRAHDTPAPAHYPPLLPLLLWLPGSVLRAVLPEFYAVRFTSIFFELLAWPLIWLMLRWFVTYPPHRHVLAAIYVVAPIAWMTTAGMVQDESILLLGVVGVILLCACERFRTAALVCGLGAVAAKIYFLIPLFALTFLAPPLRWRSIVERALLGGVPVVIVYGWTALAQIQAGLVTDGQAGVAILNKVSNVEHGVSLWATAVRYTNLAPAQISKFSGVLAFISAVIPVFLARRSLRGSFDIVVFMRVLTAMFLGVFLWFYHCDPEYYLVLVPLLLVLLPVRWCVVFVLGAFSLPYAVNLFYGVDNAMADGGDSGKMVFVRVVTDYLPVSVELLHVLSWSALIVANLALTAMMLARLAGKEAEPTALEASG